MPTKEEEILGGPKVSNPEGFSVLKAGCEEVEELRVFPYPAWSTHVEIDF